MIINVEPEVAGIRRAGNIRFAGRPNSSASAEDGVRYLDAIHKLGHHDERSVFKNRPLDRTCVERGVESS